MPESAFTVAAWVPHCDEPSCDLGTFQYECPACGKRGTDYEVWFDFEDVVIEHKTVVCNCEHCHATLTVKWHDHETHVTL